MANNTHNALSTGKPSVVVTNNPDGTFNVNGGVGNSEVGLSPISELSTLTGPIDTALDKLVIFDASTNTHVSVDPLSLLNPKLLSSTTPLTGAVTGTYEFGINITTGVQYYKNSSGNWQAFPVTASTTVTDLVSGLVNINSGTGGVQEAIRPINELVALTGSVDAVNDKIPLFDASTNTHVFVTSSQIGVIPNVRYGTVAPVVLGTDKKGDEFLQTTSGDNTTPATDSYVFDGTVWTKRSGGVTVSQGTGATVVKTGNDYNVAVANPLPPYVVGDASKSLQVNSAGTALEWVGETPLSAQLAPVLDNTIVTPPATPNLGASYIVPTGVTGAWAGEVGKIATWNGTAWVFYTPQANDITTVQTGVNAGQAYKWDATVSQWVITVAQELPVTAGGVVFSSYKTIESEGGGVYIYKGDLYAWGKAGMGINGATLDNAIHSMVPSKYSLNNTLVPYVPEFVDVVYNSQNIYAIDQNGYVWAAGKNTGRQLGETSVAAATDITAPTLIPFFFNNNIKIKSIVIPVNSGGSISVAAITETGQLYVWGHNANGQLGRGNTTAVTTPTLVTGLASTVKQVAMSATTGASMYLVLSDGKLMVAGLNSTGQLGLGNVTQQTSYVQAHTNVRQVEAWSGTAILVKNDNTVFASGTNTYGVLGQGNVTQLTTWTSVKTTGGVPIANADRVVINAGLQAETAAIITTSKKIMVAGRNANYELGLSNVTQQNFYVEPTLTQAPFQGLVKDVVLTGNLSGTNFVLTTTGDVWSAGKNTNGNRGIGNITVPTVALYGNWVKVNYPNLIVNIKGMGLDNNSYVATSIYALDVNGGIFTHGYFDQVATDGIINTQFYSPYLAPTPYTIESTNTGTVFAGATVGANGTTGLVPAPLTADTTKFLRGDGTWATQTSTTFVGVGNPNITPPSGTQKDGDFYLQTDDGTLTGTPQATWFYSNGNWIQVGGFQSVIPITTGAVRTYYPTTTALQEKWLTVTPANVPAWGFSASAGATVTNYGTVLGYQMISCTATRATLANQFTAPTSYVRHEIAITPGSDNAYFLQTIGETTARAAAFEIWVCDPVTGVPLTNGRLYAQCTDAYDINANSQSYWRSPQNTTGILDAYRQWFQWLLPKNVIDTYKTGTNTIRLAIRPSNSNGETNQFYLTGFAMAKADYGFNYTSYLSIHWNINQTSADATNGGHTPTGWQINGGIYTGYVPNNQNRTFRIPILDTTKDIYLTTMGLCRPTDNSDGAEYSLYASNFTLKHSSGDVVLGRPRFDIHAPASKWVEQGYRPLGWIIPAATLAAKVVTPTNSLVPYLSINLAVPTEIINNGHFAGFITENV